MSFSIADSFTWLYFLALLLMVIFTNVLPYFSQKRAEIQIFNTNEVDVEEELMIGVVINQIIIMIIGGIGNLLTLVAIPYVRVMYGPEFSVLQLNSMILILHLSFADLLYCALGFPHFIQVYFLRAGPEDDNLCYALGMLRNLVAYVDFNTVAMIACCVARMNLCRECQRGFREHDDHDKIFGGKRIYIVCGAIWAVSFATILPDVAGITGVYAWTASAYGCDTCCPESGCTNIGPFLNIIINSAFMILFYAALIVRLCKRMEDVNGNEALDLKNLFNSITFSLFLLIAAYLIFLLPVVAVGWGLWTPWPATHIDNEIEAGLASLYCWLYGVNFIIYLLTYYRIRDAYCRFIRDVWRVMCPRSEDLRVTSETSAFWLPLRYYEPKN